MKKDLQNKLKAYSSLAGAAALLTPFAASAEIVYTDIDPDVTLGVGENYEVDFNGDAITDMIVGVTSGAGTTASGATFYQNIAFADGNGNGSFAGTNQTFGPNLFYFPNTYAAGSSIGAGASWQPNMAFGSLNYLTSVGGAPAYFGGNFQNENDKYLAVQFNASGNTHYGWIRLDVGEAGSSNSVTVKDFAFEAVPGEGIEAGATTGGVTVGIEDFDFANQFTVYGFGNTINIQSDNAVNNVTVEVFNISGQSVMSTNMNGGAAQLQVADADGLYIVRLSEGAAVMNRQSIPERKLSVTL